MRFRRKRHLIMGLILAAGACSQAPQVEPFPEFDEEALTPAVPRTIVTNSTVVETGPGEPEPVEPADWPSFEMVFEVAENEIGRVLFGRNGFWRADRVSILPDGPAARYSRQFFGANEWTGSGEFEQEFSNGEVPWNLLSNARLPDQVFAAFGEGEATDPTHPLGEVGFLAGRTRVEATSDGIPVLIEVDGVPEFRVTELTLRPLFRGEVNRVGSTFYADWAKFLVSDASGVQASMLADGLVTFSEYESAANAAAECAGVALPEFDTSAIEFELFDEAADPTGCLDEYYEQVNEAWITQTRVLGQDGYGIRQARMDGDPLTEAMYHSEPEKERFIDHGDSWTVWAWRRGPGICIRETERNPDGTGGQSEGCRLQKDWEVPEVATASMWWGQPGDLSGAIIGLADTRVVEVRASFSNGSELSALVGESDDLLGLGAYQMSFDPGREGLPDELTFLSESGDVLGTFDARARRCQGVVDADPACAGAGDP